MNRRNFCAGVISSAFFYELCGAKLLGLTNEALGQTASPLKNYISFWMGGGAERCWFDGILTPNGSTDSLGSGPGNFTFLNMAAGNKFEYRTTGQKVNEKFYLPYLWESMLPTYGGPAVAMTSLAANTAIMRGVHTGLTFDAHGQNTQKVQVPFPNISTLGSIADNSTNILLPAVTSTGYFLSQTNKTASNVGAQSNAYDIFTSLKFESAKATPYSSSASAIMGHAKMDNIFNSFIQSIRPQLPTRSHKLMEVMMDNRRAALQLIQKGLETINQDYLAAFEKYSSIINMVMNPTTERMLPGLDDKPITGSLARTRLSQEIGTNYPNGVSSAFKFAKCNNMASAFAKAEVYLKHNITNCMQFEIGEITSIGDSTSDAYRYNFGFDCHNTGDLMRYVAWSRFYQSFAACMLHFKTQLGSTIWNSTLVNLKSEFNRGAHLERGSDHSINSCIESFFSGAVKDGPLVVGNIYESVHPCIGDGAPVQELGNQVADSKFTYSTIGSLMGFQPSRNHAPLLGTTSGQIIPLVGSPKNIKRAG